MRIAGRAYSPKQIIIHKTVPHNKVHLVSSGLDVYVSINGGITNKALADATELTVIIKLDLTS